MTLLSGSEDDAGNVQHHELTVPVKVYHQQTGAGVITFCFLVSLTVFFKKVTGYAVTLCREMMSTSRKQSHNKGIYLKALVAVAGMFMLLPRLLLAQDIPHPLQNTGIYRFVDELAATGIISVNQTIKPYNRREIAGWLTTALEKKEALTARQQKELEFYLRDFGKEGGDYGSGKRRTDLLYYSDELFTITVNPIAGGEMLVNGQGHAIYLRNGAEAHATIGGFGFYASLRDNHEKPLLGSPEYLSRRPGGHVKLDTDWSDMRAGISYQWKWGSIAFVNDGLQWGSGYNGTNIFSGHVPPFFQYRLRLNPVKWLDFNYFHGALKSMVVDSTRSYTVTNSYGTDYREVYHTKYIAANMFTFMPFEKLRLSAGNSIIYSDYGVNPAFLIPFLFFKSVDHSMNSGIDNMNSQMFFDISSHQIKNLHLYATLFIDELSLYRITKPDVWNFLSYKAGAAVYNLPPGNLSLTAEFTFTYPLTFRHYVPTLTFESNRYNLGHYLTDNAREWFVALSYRPLRTLDARLWFSDAVRGPDYTLAGGPRLGHPPLESIEWHNRSAGLSCDYQIINDLYVWLGLTYSNITGDEAYTPALFRNRTTTFNIGITAGF